MKSNQKGFTLIELLAVIVILAVIALIATPLVMGVINRARENAAIDSVYGYLDAVEQGVAEYQLTTTGMTFNPEGVAFDVEVDSARSLKVTQNTTEHTIPVNFNGSAPTEGKFKFDAEGNISTTASFVVNGYKVKVTNGVGSIDDSES